MSREPSMEDILSSIRKVIAREDGPALAPSIARGATAVVAEPDVLELDEQSYDEGDDIVANASEELVAAPAAAATRASLDALSAAVVAPEAVAAPVASGTAGRTLDDVVVEALRPMLKNWLDANLPPLVEAMVAKEIARITGRRL